MRPGQTVRFEPLRPTVVGDNIRSPGFDQESAKDQDRAVWYPYDMGGVGCVCDGTTTSPESAAAAAFISDFVRQNGGLWAMASRSGTPDPNDTFDARLTYVRDYLLYLREQLLGQSIVLPSDYSEGQKEIFEEVLREKRKTSYQTTMLMARITPRVLDGSPKLQLEYFKVGDSELFVFAPNGNLLYSTAALIWGPLLATGRRRLSFHRSTTATAVMPDGILSHKSFDRMWLCDPSAYILLASDGLIDAFNGPGELFRFMRDHELNLDDQDTLEQLHERLIDRKGDDDISFVWIPPAALGSED